MRAFLTHDPNKKDCVSVIFSSNMSLDEPAWPTPSLEEKNGSPYLKSFQVTLFTLDTWLRSAKLRGQTCKQEDWGEKIFNDVSVGDEAPDGEEMWMGYG